MRYYIRCKINPTGNQKLADAIKNLSLAKSKIFYEGMQSALRDGTIDDNNTVHFVGVCYCLEGGLSPMAMELPTLEEFFESVEEVKDARLMDESTMECDACDCTRAVKLPGVALLIKLKITRDEISSKNNSFVDFGRIPLNRKRQGQGLDALEAIFKNHAANNIISVVAVAAISGLYVYSKITNILG
jgi:hypothetical protein